MSNRSYVPRRGDAIWLDFTPQVGREQRGKRPAIVLSHDSYNTKVGLGVFCPITNKGKGYPFEVKIPNGLGVTGVVLSDQVKSLDWRHRNASLICTLPDEVLDEVLAKVEALLF